MGKICLLYQSDCILTEQKQHPLDVVRDYSVVKLLAEATMAAMAAVAAVAAVADRSSSSGSGNSSSRCYCMSGNNCVRAVSSLVVP